MEERLQHSDIRLLVLCALVAGLSLAVGASLFYEAFPEAGIDFAVTRQESRARAETFLADRGLDVKAYRHSAVFAYDGITKTFLERTLGLQGAAAAISSTVRLWRWEHRWVREGQKEEFRLSHTTDGHLVAFEHRLEEGKAGAHLPAAKARDLAERLAFEVLGHDLAAYEFVESQRLDRPNRTDHLFTWHLRDWEQAGATYRFELRLHGAKLGGFNEYLKVPETWQRQYQELRSHNQAAGQVAAVFMFFTWVALVVALAINLRRRRIRWQGPLAFGGIAAALTLLSSLNQLPVALHAFDTLDTFGGFVFRQAALALALAAAAGIGIALLCAGAEPVYRRAYPDQVGLYGLFSRHGLQTRRFVLHVCIGLALTAFFFAYQTVFYLVAERLGAWSPADIPYREMVNTRFPWITVLLIGFMPAVSEELTSRAFSIPLLTRLLRWRGAAVIVSALVWGFAHAGYPQQPFYIRGLEVGLAGILIGVVMLRWGLLPALVWHYTIDALYTALILLRSSSLYFQLTGGLAAGLVVLPLALAVALYLRRRRFADPTPLLNRAVETEYPLPTTATSIDFPQQRALPPESRLLEGRPVQTLRYPKAGAICLLAASALWLLDFEKPLEPAAVALTRDQAIETAADGLIEYGIEATTLQRVASFKHGAPPEVLQYLAEHGGYRQINRIFTDSDLGASPTAWKVRFFRPQEKEEYRLWIGAGNGRLFAWEALFAEETPGADLGRSEAVALAATHMRRFGLAPDRFTTVETSAEKLPGRTDHRLVFEALPQDDRHVGQALFRVEVRLAGERLAGLRRFYKLPETWERRHRATPTWQAVVQGVGLLAVGIVALHLLWLLIRAVRVGTIPWRLPLWGGGAAAALLVFQLGNSLPLFYDAYPTQMSVTVFATLQAAGALISALLVGLAVALALGWSVGHFPAAVAYSTRLYRSHPGLPLAATGLTLWSLWLEDQARTWILSHFASQTSTPPLTPLPYLDHAVPAISALAAAGLEALALPVAAAVAVFYLRRFIRHPAAAATAVVLVAALVSATQARDPVPLALNFALGLSQAVVWATAAWLWLREDLRAYLLTGLWSTSLPLALRWTDLTASAYQVQGYFLGASVLGLGALLLFFWRPRPVDE